MLPYFWTRPKQWGQMARYRSTLRPWIRRVLWWNVQSAAHLLVPLFQTVITSHSCPYTSVYTHIFRLTEACLVLMKHVHPENITCGSLDPLEKYNEIQKSKWEKKSIEETRNESEWLYKHAEILKCLHLLVWAGRNRGLQVWWRLSLVAVRLVSHILFLLSTLCQIKFGWYLKYHSPEQQRTLAAGRWKLQEQVSSCWSPGWVRHTSLTVRRN